MRIPLTTTSFQETRGSHHELLAEKGFEIVRERGPLTESQMLELVGDFDAFLCGDDAITAHRIGKTPSSPQSRRQIRHRFGQGGCRYCNGIENTCYILPWRKSYNSRGTLRRLHRRTTPLKPRHTKKRPRRKAGGGDVRKGGFDDFVVRLMQTGHVREHKHGKAEGGSRNWNTCQRALAG